jgi:GcrA cell cycle regulator
MDTLPVPQETSQERYWVPSGGSVANPRWTETNTEELRALYAKGFSASQIAEKLGFLSRNAVIGKISRLGLNGRIKQKVTKSERIAQGLRESALQKRLVEFRRPPKHRYRIPLIEEPLAQPTIDDQNIPTHQRCNILQLTNTTCRWPIGEVNTKEFFYCGGPADEASGRPYCMAHTARAYRAA